MQMFATIAMEMNAIGDFSHQLANIGNLLRDFILNKLASIAFAASIHAMQENKIHRL